jgi:hypothetical protein
VGDKQGRKFGQGQTSLDPFPAFNLQGIHLGIAVISGHFIIWIFRSVPPFLLKKFFIKKERKKGL